MRISCIQLKSGENYIKNCENAIRYIKESIKRKADFILTPEVTTIITKNKNLLNKYSFKMKNDPFLKEIQGGVLHLFCREPPPLHLFGYA